LEYRGYDSWGIAFGDKPEVDKRVGKISEVLGSNYPSQPAFGGVGHTRWATHGGVTDVNAHPHLDCKRRIAVVHNGIIENWKELRSKLEERRHKFQSETDTEVVAHLVEEGFGDPQPTVDRFVDVVRRTFNQLEGLNAITVYCPKLCTIVAFRNGSPLVVGVGEGENFIASDVPAFLPYTRHVVFLNDGEGVVLGSATFRILSAESGEEKKPQIEKVAWSREEGGCGRYPNYLIKEVNEQPQVLLRLAKYPEEDIQEVSRLIKNSFDTYLTACGTAAHAGLAAAYLFADISGRHVNFSVGSEFSSQERFLTPRSLLIAASQSGETMDTLEAVRSAKWRHSKVVALTNVQGSSITRMADRSLMLNCGPEKAVLATKSYTAKLAVFLLLATSVAGKLEEGRRLVRKAAEGVDEMLKGGLVGEVEKLARGIKNCEHIYAIGRGVNYATALEAALKVKEVSYIHAEGFAGGELKHGVIALVEKGTPCLVFVAEDESKASTLSNAKELKSRGGFIVGISPEDNEVFDVWLKVPDVGVASPIVNVVPAQLLAYFLAVGRGLDPDKPRNLAKSVTVK